MPKGCNHISVCVCTYKRPGHLLRLLNKLKLQRTDSLFSYSVVVVDNDCHRSAEAVVQSFLKVTMLDVCYFVEPEQNIALARNRAVENAGGEFVAFIDDDEFPEQSWLFNLYAAFAEFHADGILGPVVPHYETAPPKWIIRGRFFERPSHKTGTVLPWTNTRTGNVLLRRDIFDGEDNLFRPEFGSGGEDRDFFRRMIGRGCRFVWCAEAPVFESVPPERCSRSFMLRRALLRGKTPYNHSFAAYLRTLVAIPSYTLLLPFLLFIKHHIFMKFLISYFDHIGRVGAFFGVNFIKEKYVLK